MAEENKETNSPTQESEMKEEESDESAAEENSKMEVEEPKETKKEVKKEEKKEAVEEDEEDDDEELVGLLEKPVVLQDGLKRERKKVERMSFQSKESEEKKLEIKKGSGVALGDIPFVEHKINRAKGETLKPLYRVLFRKPGKAATCKKFIRQFSGFPFKKSDDEFEKRLAILKNKSFTLTMIKEMCDVLDIQRQGTKDEVIERVLEFLMTPKDSGKKVPTPKRKRAPNKPKPAAKKAKATKSDKSDDEVVDSDSDEEDEKDEDEAEKDDSSDDEEEPPKKKVKKLPTPKVAAKKPKEKKTPAKPKATPQKKSTPLKKKAKDSDDDVSDISSDDSDDEPLKQTAKPKGPPTNDELKDVIKKMLDNADLEAVTMKTVLKDVFAKYPDFDLSDRKEFIKNTVKQIIS